MRRISAARDHYRHYLWVEVLTERRNKEAQRDDGLDLDGAYTVVYKRGNSLNCTLQMCVL